MFNNVFSSGAGSRNFETVGGAGTHNCGNRKGICFPKDDFSSVFLKNKVFPKSPTKRGAQTLSTPLQNLAVKAQN